MKAHFMFARRVSFFHPKTPGKECFGFQTYHSGTSTSLYKLAWGKSSCVFVKILKYIYTLHQMNHTCVCAKTLRWEKQMLPGVFSMAVARMLCSSIMFVIGQLGNWVIDVSNYLPLATMSKLLQNKEGEERLLSFWSWFTRNNRNTGLLRKKGIYLKLE